MCLTMKPGSDATTAVGNTVKWVFLFPAFLDFAITQLFHLSINGYQVLLVFVLIQEKVLCVVAVNMDIVLCLGLTNVSNALIGGCLQ